MRDEPSSSLKGEADQVRFEALYAETRVAILGYLMRRSSDPSDAADLLGEVYLTAWRRLDDVPRGDEGRLWLFGVARRMLANHRRHLAVQRNLAETLRGALRTVATNAATVDPAVSDGPDPVVVACVGSLRPADREVIELSAWENLTPAEIAQVLGVKDGTVRVRLHRARAALREALLSAGYGGPIEPVECA
jgi:RNA polymerase sigma factor (sigma-70 family)